MTSGSMQQLLRTVGAALALAGRSTWWVGLHNRARCPKAQIREVVGVPNLLARAHSLPAMFGSFRFYCCPTVIILQQKSCK